jgi:nucleotidyltransferase substrate binding protein (TIGR01987 family)
MKDKDIRWEQRFSNYNKALTKLKEAVENIDIELEDEGLDNNLSELEKEGLIKRFEYTHELAWNVMKDYLKYQGETIIGGSRDATRGAFKINLINDGEIWMDMILSRNQTTYTYNEKIVQEIFIKIIRAYYPRFISFQNKMEELRSGRQGDFFSKEV